MRKINNFTLALVTVLIAVSCQQKHLDMANGLSTVSFTVEVPGHAVTKTSGNDVLSNINNIVYAVYKTDAESLEDARTSLAGKTPINRVNPMAEDPTNTTVFVNNNANISVELFNDQKYIILFWAQVDQTWVEGTDFDLTDITYPDNLEANQSKYEAFCGAAFVAKVKGSRSESVELSRPHAQINIASAPTGFPVDIQTSKVKVSGAGASFNVATGKASGNTDITFKESNNPEGTFSTAYPHYIASNYVFANGNVSVEYELTANLGTISRFENPISNVPVARNYKTNIVGNLLSSDIEYNMTLEDWGTPDDEVQVVSDYKEFLDAIKNGGQIKLIDDIQIKSTLDIKAGVDVYLDLNGKEIRVDATDFKPNSNGSQYVFIIREGGSLVIDGEGTVETSTPAPIMFYPAGDLVIENGTFIRNIPEEYTGSVGNMFVGTKPDGGWHSAGVTINGGYFDSGYYRKGADYIEDYLNDSKTIPETETDIQKRGQSGDPNPVRGALKNNISVMFNKSNNYFLVYGGTFVGANPAWGDEGCMLPTTPQYLRPWSYYQGAFLDGQKFHEDGIVLPEGYTITQSTHADGRPIYTVSYTKPESDATAQELPNE